MKIEFTQGHSLDLPTLRARFRRRFEHYADRYGSMALREHIQWGDRSVRGHFRGGNGLLTLDEREVTVTLDLPLFAHPLRTRIERAVRRELSLATVSD